MKYRIISEPAGVLGNRQYCIQEKKLWGWQSCLYRYNRPHWVYTLAEAKTELEFLKQCIVSGKMKTIVEHEEKI